MLNDYQNSFTDSEFLVKSHYQSKATLPCEVLMSENQRHTETYIVISEKSPGSVRPCLECRDL